MIDKRYISRPAVHISRPAAPPAPPPSRPSNRSSGRGRNALSAALAAVLALGFVLAPARAAEAQDMTVPPPEQVDSDGQGIVGLGLIGAELGFVIPALAGLDDTWAFIVFPIVGAAGGATAGYFLLERNGGEPELGIASLGVGMALIIPTMVYTLSATAYDPEDEPTRMQETAREAANAVARRRDVPDATTDRLASSASGGGMVRWNTDRGVDVGMPSIASLPSLSREDVRRFGLEQRAELRVGLVSGRF